MALHRYLIAVYVQHEDGRISHVENITTDPTTRADASRRLRARRDNRPVLPGDAFVEAVMRREGCEEIMYRCTSRRARARHTPNGEVVGPAQPDDVTECVDASTQADAMVDDLANPPNDPEPSHEEMARRDALVADALDAVPSTGITAMREIANGLDALRTAALTVDPTIPRPRRTRARRNPPTTGRAAGDIPEID